MKSPAIARIIASTVFAFAVVSCAGQKGRQAADLSGTYRKDKSNELLILRQDHSFVCLRNSARQQDVIVPECDTLASGSWQQRNNFIVLHNREDYNKIDYSVAESATGSPDSLYFSVVLPKEDALTDGKFRYSILPSPMSKVVQSDKPEFSVVNDRKGRVKFGFNLRDLAPNCESGAGCGQRIYFDVFQDYRPANAGANTFVITLGHFNQCFYEALDVDNEVIGVTETGLFWKGGAYRKVKA
jgi:hypothetical protein